VRQSNQTRTLTTLVATALTVVLTSGIATADPGSDPGFLRTERLVTGSSLSGSWRNLEFASARTFDLARDTVDAVRAERLLTATYRLDDHVDALEHAASAGHRSAVKIAFDLRDQARREST